MIQSSAINIQCNRCEVNDASWYSKTENICDSCFTKEGLAWYEEQAEKSRAHVHKNKGVVNRKRNQWMMKVDKLNF